MTGNRWTGPWTARSIRVVAVQADELLEERTLPSDVGAVERVLRVAAPWYAVVKRRSDRFGLAASLVERGIACQVVAPGWYRSGQATGSRPTAATRKLARLLAGGLLEPIHVPSRELEAAGDLVLP